MASYANAPYAVIAWICNIESWEIAPRVKLNATPRRLIKPCGSSQTIHDSYISLVRTSNKVFNKICNLSSKLHFFYFVVECISYVKHAAFLTVTQALGKLELFLPDLTFLISIFLFALWTPATNTVCEKAVCLYCTYLRRIWICDKIALIAVEHPVRHSSWLWPTKSTDFLQLRSI